MDVVTIGNDGQFDTGLQPITTSATLQEVCRIPAHGKRCLMSIVVAGGTVADLQILQGAFRDDPNPIVIADSTGLNSPALSNESYIAPTLSFPFGPAAVQVHLQGDAYEIIIKAQGASTAGVTVRVEGFVREHSN